MKPRAACEACLVRDTAWCRALPAPALARASRLTFHRRIAAGQTIVTAADGCDAIATIVSGAVKIVRALADGRQQIVALHFPGDFIGTLLGSGDDDVAVAASDVELCCLDHDGFATLTDADPGLLRELLLRTRADLDTARDWMLLLGRKSAEERIASLLLLLARRSMEHRHDRAPTPVTVRLPMSRTDIADFLGLTIETVSRQIHRLKNAGIIEIERQRDLKVHDLARLRREAERPEI